MVHSAAWAAGAAGATIARYQSHPPRSSRRGPEWQGYAKKCTTAPDDCIIIIIAQCTAHFLHRHVGIKPYMEIPRRFY